MVVAARYHVSSSFLAANLKPNSSRQVFVEGKGWLKVDEYVARSLGLLCSSWSF